MPRSLARWLLMALWLAVPARAAVPLPEAATQLQQASAQIQGYLAQGRAPEAVALAREALTFAEAQFGRQSVQAGAAWSDQAEVQRSIGHLPEAADAFANAEALLAGQPPNNPVLATARYRRADLLRMLGKPAPALALYRQVEAVYVQLYGAQNTAVATCWNAEAEMLRLLGQPAEALPLHDRAVAAFVAIAGPRHPYVATALQARATTRQAMGDYLGAAADFRAAYDMDVAALGKTHPWTATLANNLAELERLLGHPKLAEALFDEALAAYQKTLGPRHPFIASALVNLANVTAEQGRGAEAHKLLQQARAMLEATEGVAHPDIATVLYHEAALARARADYPAAQTALQQALAMREAAQGPEHPDVAFVLDALAGLALERGAYGEVEALCQRALAVRQKALGTAHPDTAATLLILAQYFVQLGDFAHAEPLLRDALARTQTGLGAQHPRVGDIQNALGGLLYARGQFAQARMAWRTALDIARAAYGEQHLRTTSALSNLAAADYALGHAAEARQEAARAAAIEDGLLPPRHPSRAVNWFNQAVFQVADGKPKAALELLRKAEALERETAGPASLTLAQTQAKRADILLAQNDLKGALAARTAAAATFDRHLQRWLGLGGEQQKVALVAQQLAHLYATVSLHLDHLRGDKAAARLAFDAILRRKGLTVDAMADAMAQTRRRLEPADQALFDQLAASRAALATVTLRGLDGEDPQAHAVRLHALQAAIDAQETALARRNPGYRAGLAVATTTAVAAAVPKDAVLVEFLKFTPPGEAQLPRYAAYVLRTAGEPVGVDLGDAATIEAALTGMRAAMGSAKRDDALVRAEELSELLLTPLRPYLADAAQWLIAPDDALSLLPFAVLTEPGGRWVLERHTVTVLGSGRELARPRPPVPPPSDAWVLADPDFDASGDKPADHAATRGSQAKDFAALHFSPLQGTAEEADAVAPLLQAKLLTGPRATEAALRALHGPRILHLATHGYFLPQPPTAPPGNALAGYDQPLAHIENPLLRSGLALAGFNVRRSGSDDGALTALEAMSLDLAGTQLVVLSACNTGLGDVSGGFGVYGLRRAFAIAGAESVLMSLWSVDDQATRALMTSFYGKLSAGEGRSEALRRAQLELLAQPRTRKPFYWAAFQLVGDWRPLR